MTDHAIQPAPHRLLLASRSPRRRAMLRDAGIPFELAEATLDDGGLRPGGVPPEHWVAALAYLKARSVAETLPDSQPIIVLGADTLCVRDGSLLGQPADAAEARRMIESFVGAAHRVITGLALVSPKGHRQLVVDAAQVVWGALDPAEIDRYIETMQWRGKAGAYNLAERVAAGWPIRVEGDPATVMGLPMRRLPSLLRDWSICDGAAA